MKTVEKLILSTHSPTMGHRVLFKLGALRNPGAEEVKRTSRDI